METIVLGLIIACGSALSGLIGAATAWIRNGERKLREGNGTMASFDEIKRLRKIRGWAGVGVVASLVALVTILSV